MVGSNKITIFKLYHTLFFLYLDFSAKVDYNNEWRYLCGCSLVVEFRLPKPDVWVRFPSPAPIKACA